MSGDGGGWVDVGELDKNCPGDNYEPMFFRNREPEKQHTFSEQVMFGGEPLTNDMGYVGPYKSLRRVLDEAFNQASAGKGKERHAEQDEPFDRQVICEVRRRVGGGYTLGQATKKIYESQRLDGERGIAELLGAINYIAAEIIVRREGK